MGPLPPAREEAHPPSAARRWRDGFAIGGELRMASRQWALTIPMAVQTSEVDRARIRELAAQRAPGTAVVSLYLPLDPAEAKLPRARRTELESLLGQVERRHLGADGEGTHEERASLRASLARIRRFFAEGGLGARSARGVAVFCAEDAGLFEALKLPEPIEAQVAVGDAPFVEPLLELTTTGDWVVLLASRRAARVLRGSADSLVELASLRDDVHRWHSQGGWSQARYQRGIEKETADHVKRACELLFRMYRRRPFEHLLVGGPREMWSIVEERLHPYLRERLAGHIEADVERTSPEEVLSRAAAEIDATERAEERELLDRLGAGVGTGDQAVAGRDQVMTALRERRVALLLVAEGAPAEEEIKLALGQSAGVRIIRHHGDELRKRGEIGALLRY